MLIPANLCIGVVLDELRGVDSAQYCLTQTGAQSCPKKKQLTLDWPVPLSLFLSLCFMPTPYIVYMTAFKSGLRGDGLTPAAVDWAFSSRPD